VARVLAIGCLLATFAFSGCAGASDPQPSPAAQQRAVAERFATDVLRGDEAGARRLLLHPNEEALVFLVRRAAHPWAGQRVSFRLPARRAKKAWAIHYTGTRTHEDGTFEREIGDLVVYVARSPKGAAVRYFLFTNVKTRFSTHHDALLPPSKR
jgi:hypothetical protein